MEGVRWDYLKVCLKDLHVPLGLYVGPSCSLTANLETRSVSDLVHSQTVVGTDIHVL